MPLSHRHIEVFRAVMTSGSVTAAAQALHTSQPTVSRELARAEQLLGLTLFDRVRGRLRPTAQALSLYEEVQRSYVGLERIQSLAARLQQFALGQLAVACLPAFSQALLPGACARLLAAHPHAGVALTALESPFLEERLASQQFDLGLTEQGVAPPGTRADTLLRLDEVAVLPEGHALAAKAVLQPRDFAGQPFISLAPGDPYRLAADELFARHGVARRQVLETPSAVSVCAMVRHGLGLAIVNPITAAEHAGAGLVVRRLGVSIPFQVSLVRPLHRPGNPLADRLETALREEARQLKRRLRA